MSEEAIWTSVGFLGQALFGSRFLVQWIASERRRRSVIPLAFWFFSLGGGVTLLAYAIWLEAYPIILGQAFGLIVYSRNLYLIYRGKLPTEVSEVNSKSPAPAQAADPQVPEQGSR